MRWGGGGGVIEAPAVTLRYGAAAALEPRFPSSAAGNFLISTSAAGRPEQNRSG